MNTRNIKHPNGHETWSVGFLKPDPKPYPYVVFLALFSVVCISAYIVVYLLDQMEMSVEDRLHREVSVLKTRLTETQAKYDQLNNEFINYANVHSGEISVESRLLRDVSALKTTLTELQAKYDQLNNEFINFAHAHNGEHIKRQINSAIEKYEADKTGLIDYALESGGGGIKAIEGTKSYNVRSLWGLLELDPFNPPEAMIRPGNQPGKCFAFCGSIGRVRIQLSTRIEVTAVSMEHAHYSIVQDVRSAPREFSVYGIDPENKPILLGQFEYTLSKFETHHTVQTFKTSPSKMFYKFIELKIESNHGNPEYTCVYRFRVHGIPY